MNEERTKQLQDQRELIETNIQNLKFEINIAKANLNAEVAKLKLIENEISGPKPPIVHTR